MLFDDRILRTADYLRERFGPAFINTYALGQQVINAYKLREWSGLRTPGSLYFSPTSQHTYGRAFDMIFKEHGAEEIRQEIVSNPDDPAFLHINAIETNVSWLHIDCRNVNRIFQFAK